MTDTRRVDLPGSILNPGGVNNPSGATATLRNVPRPTATAVDPQTVMTESTGVDPIVMQLVQSHASAEAVAQRLLQRYGGFTAQTKAAILANLTWIGGTAITYDNSRVDGAASDTQTPNDTIQRGTGVCRDTHCALAAILSAVMNGGTPSNDRVRCIGFTNPKENHVYLVYQDPASGRWNALEYGRHYELQAASDIDAFAALPNYVASYKRYVLNGFAGRPTQASRDFSDTRVRDFFQADAGIGSRGEVRTSVGSDQIAATGFVSKNVAVMGAFEPRSLSGGAKLNYHGDFTSGYVHAAAGAYSQAYEASAPGQRGVADRTTVRQNVVGAQVDVVSGGAVPLASDHLKLRYGADVHTTIALPVSDDKPSLKTYSDLTVGATAGVAGSERLSDHWRADWAVHYRHRVEPLSIEGNTRMTGASHLAPALVADVNTLSAAAALSYADRFRVEAGSDRTVVSSFGPALSRGSEYVSIGAGSDRARGAVVLRAETTSAGLTVRISDRVSVGAAASVLPRTGDAAVNANAAVRF